MKKLLVLILCLALAASFAACSGSANTPAATVPATDAPAAAPADTPAVAQPTAEPAPTAAAGEGDPTVSDYPGYATFDEYTVVSIDLDRDGAMESVTVEIVPEQDYELEKRRIVVTEENGDRAAVELTICGFFHGFISDVNGDRSQYILASGDEESCDYSTWLLRYENGQITSALSPLPASDFPDGHVLPTVSGNVMGISDGIVTVESTIDLLGTWGAETQYTIQAEPFALVRVPGSVYTRDASWLDNEYWDNCMLTTTRELPVTFTDEVVPSMLEVGVKIGLTETDYETYVAFQTQDGRTGRIAVERNTAEWGWLIGDLSEGEYFESVPYAG